LVDLFAGIGSQNCFSFVLFISTDKHQRPGGELRHLHRVQRDIEGVADVRLPIGRQLRLEGIPEDAVPILQRGIRGDGNAFMPYSVGDD
jgi:hypothetical protein